MYPGYCLRLWCRDTLGGIPILRVPLYPSHEQSTLRRVLNYLSFAACSAGPLIVGWRPDVVYVYNLVTLGVLAAVNRFIRGVPYVLDLQDIWPDSIQHSGIGQKWMYRSVEAMCRIAYRNAARLVVLSPGFKAMLAKRGVPFDRVELIYNWCHDEFADSVPSKRAGPCKPVLDKERFTILFAGNFGPAQGLKSVIEAAAITQRIRPRIQWIFMGDGVESASLRNLATRVAPRATSFLDRRPLKEASEVLQQADVLLIHLQDRPLFEITIPSKTQAYLAAGKPILVGARGDTAELVLRAGAGIACEPNNPLSLATAALGYSQIAAEELKAMGRRGRDFYERNLSMSSGVARFEVVFESTRSK